MEELIPIFFFLSVAAVMILRPLTKRLGILIEQIARDRNVVRTDETELARVRVLLEHMSKRMELVEERVDFTERLVGNRRSQRAASDLLGHGGHDPIYDERASYPAGR